MDTPSSRLLLGGLLVGSVPQEAGSEKSRSAGSRLVTFSICPSKRFESIEFCFSLWYHDAINQGMAQRGPRCSWVTEEQNDVQDPHR